MYSLAIGGSSDLVVSGVVSFRIRGFRTVDVRVVTTVHVVYRIDITVIPLTLLLGVPLEIAVPTEIDTSCVVADSLLNMFAMFRYIVCM